MTEVGVGSDAEIDIFDYDRFTSEIVPAFRRLLEEGDVAPWFEDVYRVWEPNDRPWPTIDLKRHCTYLGDDLRCRIVPPLDAEWDDWSQRACSSTECPERGQCPFHRDADSQFAEKFAMVLDEVVEKFALGKGQFVGRTVSVGLYRPFLVEQGIGPEHPIHLLFDAIQSRGRVVGYGWAGALEGIHGWLTSTEANQLSELLSNLPLPEYDVSFDAMERFRPVKPGPFEAPGIPFPQLSLSFVRTVATIASTEGKGVIWLNH